MRPHQLPQHALTGRLLPPKPDPPEVPLEIEQLPLPPTRTHATAPPVHSHSQGDASHTTPTHSDATPASRSPTSPHGPTPPPPLVPVPGS
ncbi:hypothetical protein GCM10010286_17910 [Streptomyces toxytricini]|nr:hypothetical protein GCM10010286_17910 [Streptomyces toxytricini]